MKVYNDDGIFDLHSEILEHLASVRQSRGFSVSHYIESKTGKINKYMRECGLDTCVVAISGGVDSAVVYALVQQAMQATNSPIKEIVPIFLPVYNSEGATNQNSAYAKAQELTKVYGQDLIEINITNAHAVLKEIVDNSLGVVGEGWASGQLVSYLRTPTYFYVTSLLNQQGKKPIVCGTTNRDEGAYLGYFGKASDGMVDVQVISDLHKSEVYAVGIYLKVPESILSAVPTGDMYDGRHDEQVFGAPYDFVELYMAYLNMPLGEKHNIMLNLSPDARDEFKQLSNNLESLHSYNKHKYLGASPAVHFDVIEGKVRGGWYYNNYK